MKILHVIPYCYPAYAYGGPPKAVYELAKRQVESGHDVVVLTTTAYEKIKVLPRGEEIVDGIQIVRLPNISNWLMWKYHFSTPKGVSLFLKNKSFNVIHLHEIRTLLNLLLLLMVSSKVKIIISPWGTLPYSKSLVSFKKVFDFFIVPLLRKKVSVALAQTSHEFRLVKGWNIAKRIKLVPLAISVSEFKKIPTKSLARVRLGMNKDDFIYLFLGRFSPHKGIDLIINSFEKVATQVPNARLLLVGRDDNYLSKLQSLVRASEFSEKIIIHNALYGKDRLLAYAAADVFVFTPTVFEETGTVCLEALACGVPVITTMQAEIPLLNSRDGVFHIEHSEKQLTKYMLAAHSRNISVNVKKLKRLFDWDEITKTVTNIYTES